MKLQVANKQTGEVIEANCKTGIKCIQGYIREWMKDGLSIHDFQVIHASEPKLQNYIQEYAWGWMISKCDICDIPAYNKDMVWVNDYADVCIMASCEDCVK
jgi:hypothetical protein